MLLINRLITTGFGYRLLAIDKFCRNPFDVQHQQFKLLSKDNNAYLSRYGDVSTIEKFRSVVPIVDYSDLSPYVDRILDRQSAVLWGGSPTLWAAKSSGTTGGPSKFIPITQQYLDNCHYRGGRDSMVLAARNFPDNKAFSGKSLTLGGSAVVERQGGLKIGDLSATLIENSPRWFSLLREPSMDVALMSDFNSKVEAICRTVVGKNVTCFAGVPSWNLVLMNRILDYTGKRSLLDVWENLSLFVHGGVAFAPYRAQFEALIPSDSMRYMETYNASEGFFALQDDPTDSSMLLMLDYEIFYEFIPFATLDDPTTAVTLEGVCLGVNYAMIISTSCGLWRYMIGDTVEFTSTSPYRIRITGRTKHFINVFGEEVIVDNTDKALHIACLECEAVVAEYTVAPIYMDGRSKGSHQWVIEFAVPPSDVENFAYQLDVAMQSVNSDYQAKRHNDSTLYRLTLNVAPAGTFMLWFARRGKIGGQNKVPRLSNTRRWVDELLPLFI